MKKKLLCFFLVAAILVPALPVTADNSCHHEWSEWDTTIEPDCGNTGEESRFCFNCYEYQTRTVPATGDHLWDDWYNTKKSTIHKTGLKKRECMMCYATQTKKTAKVKPYVKFTKKTVKLKVSKTYKLKIKYAKGDSVKKWKSSNKRVATVSKKGKVKAKRKGTAKITVIMRSGKKATCKIKVSRKKKASKKKTVATVYWTPGGSVYHSTINCPTLSRSRTIYYGSVSSCPKSRPCKVCF